MSTDLPADSSRKWLNQAVALTVVALSVFLGLCNVKDGNIMQAMQQDKADAVDTWDEYQAAKIKQHIDVRSADQGPAVQAEIAKYRAEAPTLQAKAHGFEADYDALNHRDDQFDAADAMISIAISLAGVAALADTPWVLFVGWAFGLFGVVMGVAGFASLPIHVDVLAKLLS